MKCGSLSRRDLLRRLTSLPAACVAGATEGVTFSDVAAQAGLARARNVSGSPTNKQFLLEEMGGGVALFDFDNDGWLDIFLVNGSSSLNVPRKMAGSVFWPALHGVFPNPAASKASKPGVDTRRADPL